MNMLANVVYDGQLSGEAIAILVIVAIVIFGGLSWCFYRAIKAAKQDPVEQVPDEV